MLPNSCLVVDSYVSRLLIEPGETARVSVVITRALTSQWLMTPNGISFD